MSSRSQSARANRSPSPASRPEGADPQKRARIVAAAEAMFMRLGVKRTSIDDIAREAGIAKGTIYLYFKSKEEVFAALAAEMCAVSMAGVHAALGGAGTLSQRLAGALDAKIGRFHRLIANSPFSAELMESKALAARAFEDLDAQFRKALGDAIGEAKIGKAADRAELVDTVLAAGYGVWQLGSFRGESDPAQTRKRLERHLDLLLKGLAAK